MKISLIAVGCLVVYATQLKGGVQHSGTRAVRGNVKSEEEVTRDPRWHRMKQHFLAVLTEVLQSGGNSACRTSIW